MDDLTLDTVVRHAGDVLYRDLDGEAVIVDLRTGTYFGLDPVGTVIWAALEKPSPLRKALDAVLACFEVEEAVAGPDLLRLAGEMLGKELLVRDRAAGEAAEERLVNGLPVRERAAAEAAKERLKKDLLVRERAATGS